MVGFVDADPHRSLRGIGRALALALPPSVGCTPSLATRAALGRSRRRDRHDRARRGHHARPAPLDDVAAGATLVHNAGVCGKSQRNSPLGGARVGDERARPARVPEAAPVAALARVLVIGAGLMIRGRFDACRTPIWRRLLVVPHVRDDKVGLRGRDARRGARNPHLDVAVIHPRRRASTSARGAASSGWLVDRVKQRWESPEDCAGARPLHRSRAVVAARRCAVVRAR